VYCADSQYFNKPAFKTLLPDPLPAPHQRPYTLLVDLEGMLVTSTWDVSCSAPRLTGKADCSGHMDGEPPSDRVSTTSLPTYRNSMRSSCSPTSRST
jgi:hypothetical protein